MTGPSSTAPRLGSQARERSAAFERDGYVLVPGLVSAAETVALRRALEAKLDVAGQGDAVEQGSRLKYAVTENPAALRLLMRIVHRSQVLPFATERQRDPIIEHTKALLKSPHGPWTPWHQDAGYWEKFDPEHTMFTLWIALTPIDEQNGCLRVIPGSHRGERLPHEALDGDPYELAIAPQTVERLERETAPVDVVLEPGDAVLFDCKLVHSARPNGTDHHRMALKVAFQDRERRKPGIRNHKTWQEIPLHLDEVAPPQTSTRKSLKRRTLAAAQAFGPPFSTLVEKGRKLRRKKPKTFTQRLGPLRQFQLKGSEREWQQLFFYHELLQRVDGVPGDVAEFGVAGGISIVSMVRILRMLEPTSKLPDRRMLYGFDSFEGLPELSAEDSTVNTEASPDMHKGGFYDPSGYGDLFEFAEDPQNNLRLVRGWFDETLPTFLSTNPAVAFALVHVDCDLYESTKVVLDLVWDHVVPGGVIAFDELFHPAFPGETRAFREWADGKAFTIHRSRMWPTKKYLVKGGAPGASSGLDG